MTPTEKDAMALAVLEKAHGTFDNIRFERRHDKPDVSEYWTERIREVIEARTHLASRIAELEGELEIQREQNRLGAARELEFLDRATRAEAELAAVREDAALLAWLSDEFDKNGSISFTQYSVGTAGCELFTITTQRVRGYQLRGAIRAAIAAARGGE